MKKSKTQKARSSGKTANKKSLDRKTQSQRFSGTQKAPVPVRLENIKLVDISSDPKNRRFKLTQTRFKPTRKATQERRVLAPVAVFPRKSGGYRLVDGELRVEVARLEGMTEISALVFGKKPSLAQLRTDQILFKTAPSRTPFERAEKYQRLVDAHKGNQARAAKAIGIDRKTIGKYVAFSRIGTALRAEIERYNSVQEDKETDPLSFGHIYQIALAKTGKERKHLAQLAMGGATTERLEKERLNPKPTPSTDAEALGSMDKLFDPVETPAGVDLEVTGDEVVGAGETIDTTPGPAEAQKLPVAIVPVGDYREMMVGAVAWEPASQEEVDKCIPVAQALGALDPRNNASHWPAKGVRMNWKGDPRPKGSVRFIYRVGLICLGLREPVEAVQRKAFLISSIFGGDALQQWT